MSVQPLSAIGRVKTAMVFSAEGQARGAVCTVLARVRHDDGSQRTQIGGSVKFEPSLVEHIEQRVLPLVDSIGEALLPVYRPAQVELSAINIGAASVHDVGIAIAGFSADAPIFLAVLSAMLAMPVRQDVIVSGHLSSDQGDIGAVRGLPEKLAAATSDSSIRTCLIPSTTADTSLETLLPAELERVLHAMIQARRELHIVEIRDVEELIRHAIDDESVVLGSLRGGFFEVPTRVLESATPIARAVRLLAESLDSRFLAAIERSLFPLNIDALHELLAARAEYAVDQARYPQGLGAKLRRFMLSLPPAMRRKAKLFPLLPKTLSLAVCALVRGRTGQFVIAGVHVVAKGGVHVFVAQHLLHQRNVGRRSSQPGRKRVPQVVRVGVERNRRTSTHVREFRSQLPYVVTLVGRRDEQRAADRLAAVSQTQSHRGDRRPVKRNPALLLALAHHVQQLLLDVDAEILDAQRAELAVANAGVEQKHGEAPFSAHLLPRSRAFTSDASAGLDGPEPLARLLPGQRRALLLGDESRPRDAQNRILREVALLHAPLEPRRQRGQIVGHGLSSRLVVEPVIAPGDQVVAASELFDPFARKPVLLAPTPVDRNDPFGALHRLRRAAQVLLAEPQPVDFFPLAVRQMTATLDRLFPRFDLTHPGLGCSACTSAEVHASFKHLPGLRPYCDLELPVDPVVLSAFLVEAGHHVPPSTGKTPPRKALGVLAVDRTSLQKGRSPRGVDFSPPAL